MYAACGIQGYTPLQFPLTGSLGWRVSMEDSHIANLKIGKGIYLFGVFDGHGGKPDSLTEKIYCLIGGEVAEFVKRHFTEELVKNSNFKNKQYELALQENFMQMDKIMLKPEGYKELK
jgi:protein phosphatase 1G